MFRINRFFTFLILLLSYLPLEANELRPLPQGLKCELFSEPLGVDVAHPGLSYVLKASGNQRDLRQVAYQILVADKREQLENNVGNLWNSGKVFSDKMAYISYAGKPLKSGRKYWWKVKIWDNKGRISPWSSVASWTMGILTDKEWSAKWISARGAEQFSLSPFGFRANTSQAENTVKWVQVDLGKKSSVQSIRLTPMFFEDRAGYGFPKNFKIEISDDDDFSKAVTIVDYSKSAFANPGWKPASFPFKNTSGRFVRLTANSLWGGWQHFNFALRQIEIINNGQNIASGCQVSASDSNEKEGWKKNRLTDQPRDRSAIPNYSSMAIRKDFDVEKGLKRAVIFISGMSEFELSLNGKKVGKDLLVPGWTDYKQTVLYATYDITTQLQKGRNALGIILGNGMYNIQPDTLRYVKFLNAYGPLKAIAQVRLEFVDGSVKTIGTDRTWQVSPGPITYSNMFGGEDYNANLEIPGWNRAGFRTDKSWADALEISGPGGRLKGLSCSAPAVRVIETRQAVAIHKIKENVWVYDFGQNASMMPKIVVRGEKGAYVRMIPSELLGTDGLVDRKSATQDGVRPAWWQYTLSGKEDEHWQPKFFYQGARYLQVEFFASKPGGTLPELLAMEDLIVHSSSTPVGKFNCSNVLFNQIYDLVRWAQRSNMQSLMTDCPHREKMGWLEENHLNGPSLRYNFDMAPLFRKTMSDMSDAQLPNGLIPNIAPEYFIAGSAEMGNGFRNSTEWGSSFIIVAWQQYLFSGDISLLERYYDRMKKYVSFLAASSQNDIIVTGLGDWYDIGPKPAWGSQLTPVSFTGTAIYYYDNLIMQYVAAQLGKRDDEVFYRTASQKISKAFNNKFFNTETGLYSTGSNTTCAMPLSLGLIEPHQRTRLLNALVDSIRKNNNSFNSGEVGYRFLLRALADGGRSDVVYEMNNQTDKPGYGYQVKKGATSLTEKWDAGVGDFGSQNHFMSGQINEWFFSDLIGISPDQSGPGFRKFIIKPSILGKLDWVNGTFRSISGDITCSWKRANGRIDLKVSVPVNTSATIYIPSLKPGSILEGGKQADSAVGIRLLGEDSGHTKYQIVSGEYRFVFRDDN